MNCDEWFEKLYLYIDKDLKKIDWDHVEEHMKGCRPCWDRYEIEVKLKERLSKSCSVERCSESFRLRIKAILEKF
jgi:mycothiol system anti-sigma-R factor